MAFINGYKYNTIQEAQNAVSMCNSYYNIPLPNDETLNWCFYSEATYDNPIFYFITFDESLTVVLGQPSIFEVTVPFQ